MKGGFKKIRVEIIYSALVMMLIPGVLVLNTVMFSRAVQKNFDTELRRKADLANTIFGVSISQDIKDKNYSAISTTVTEIIKQRPDLSNVEVVIQDGKQWRVVASSVSSRENFNTNNIQYDIVKDHKQAVATLVDIQTPDGKPTQAWYVVSPIISDKEVVAVSAVNVSTADAQEVITSSLNRAFLVLLASIVVVVLLLLNHYRFVGYAQLLDKQRELNQLMSDFLSVATHELKAPMAVIKGNINNIEDGVFGPVPETISSQLKAIEQQTDRLAGLINDLLNVSRIEQGKISYTITSVDLSETIKGIVNFYHDKAASKGITVHYDQTTAVPVMVDAGRAQEIFTNLIDNAVKYTVEAKDVFITHEVVKGTVITRVRDGGIGINTDEQKRLFQRFYRVQNDQTAHIGGTGLGLWIIKKYIDAMGGKIEVSSMKDAGTEFAVTFPSGNVDQQPIEPTLHS
jgi:signal transduction histidine kinase